MQIGDKITVNKVRYIVYDLDEPGNYICLKCSHAYLKNKQCANCGAKRDGTGRFSEGDIAKEYKDTTVGRISKLIN